MILSLWDSKNNNKGWFPPAAFVLKHQSPASFPFSHSIQEVKNIFLDARINQELNLLPAHLPPLAHICLFFLIRHLTYGDHIAKSLPDK